MTRISTLLIDDETGSRGVLRNLLEKHFPEIEVTGEAEHAQAAYELILAGNPRLVFLDIQMPRADGFSLLKRFEEVPFEVIFVTSHDQYAINAIRFNALDYLLKPISVQELKFAVQKAVARIKNSTTNSRQIVSLLHNLNAEAIERKIAVHAGEKVKLLHVQDIEYVEADRRYCQLHMVQNECYTMARSLSDFENYLGESYFVRISKSYLVNTMAIKEYSKGEPFIITLKSGKILEIPRRKKAEVLEKFKDKRYIIKP